MPLDLPSLARQTRLAAAAARSDEASLAARVAAAVARLRSLDHELVARRVVERVDPPWLAGVPLGPLSAFVDAPAAPRDYVVVSADGSHLDRDHHRALACWLINIGRAVIRYGVSASAELDTASQLGYLSEDMYFVHEERRSRVQGQLLNVRRQVAEMAALADLCEANPGSVALVDGTLILTSISRAIQPEPTAFLDQYLAHVDRIRATGSLVASYVSRPSSGEAVAALRLACCPRGECDRACRLALEVDRACAQPGDLPDSLVFDAAGMCVGQRTCLWRSTWPTSERYYGEHAIHFFYVDAGPEVARVEVPWWVSRSDVDIARLHAVIRAQCERGDQGYPRALIEAHHKAVITAGDRRAFDALLDDALAGRGLAALPSAKERAKRRRAL